MGAATERVSAPQTPTGGDNDGTLRTALADAIAPDPVPSPLPEVSPAPRPDPAVLGANVNPLTTPDKEPLQNPPTPEAGRATAAADPATPSGNAETAAAETAAKEPTQEEPGSTEEDTNTAEVQPGSPAPRLGGGTERTAGAFRAASRRLPTIGGDGQSNQPGAGGGLPTIGDETTTPARSGRFASLGTASRLPTVGNTPAAAPTAPPEPSPGAKAPFEANALPFQGSTNPLMAVVMLDTGGLQGQLDSIRKLGLPLAIAVPVDAPDATDRARRYRNAGFEVLALAPNDVNLSLSGGQNAGQVGALLDEFFRIMPDALGLIDRPRATLQKDRRLARYVVEHLADTGHGLVTYDEGFNSVPQLAAAQDVPAGAVFRFIDKSGEAGDVIDRTLNRAGFEARSNGAVIVMTTPSPATLQTLLSWAASSKARGLDLAPVSAALQRAGS
ncbi:MAG: divergent polysaccharide deacetylase family protein [Pseudomonadota bacterium]